jgi:hypothetical protein
MLLLRHTVADSPTSSQDVATKLPSSVEEQIRSLCRCLTNLFSFSSFLSLHLDPPSITHTLHNIFTAQHLP